MGGVLHPLSGDPTFTVGFIAAPVKDTVDCLLSTLHMLPATLERGTPITLAFVFNGIFDLLILCLFLNLGFIQSNGTDLVLTSPETVPCKLFLRDCISQL